MAATKHLQDEVLKFSLKANESLNQFSYPDGFKTNCEEYLRWSPPYGGLSSPPRFQTLNFEGLISYNSFKSSLQPHEKESEEHKDTATTEDVKNWKIAINCLQRYCLNLLLAPRRQDFHQIKVGFVELVYLRCEIIVCMRWFRNVSTVWTKGLAKLNGYKCNHVQL